MTPGWTYLMEAVYPANTHVIFYPFQGLVLLGAVSPEGEEMQPGPELNQLAAQLGVMAVPAIRGLFAELEERLSVGTTTHLMAQQASSKKLSMSMLGETDVALMPLDPTYSMADWGDSDTEAGSVMDARTLPPASHEGWVVADAGGVRHKLVQHAYKCSSAAAHALHPMLVWDAVRRRGASYGHLAASLPQHCRQELDAILNALLSQFRRVQQALQQQLEAWSGGLSGTATDIKHLGGDAVLPIRARYLGASVSAEPAGPVGSDDGGAPEVTPAMVRSVMSALTTGASTTATAQHTSAAPAPDTTDASGPSPVEAAVHRALQYVLQKRSTTSPSLFYHASSLHSIGSEGRAAPLLRVLILDCIQPGPDGCLQGYTPSPAFQQTFAKGWARRPVEGPAAPIAQSAAVLQLPDGHIMPALDLLEPKHMIQAALVCRQ